LLYEIHPRSILAQWINELKIVTLWQSVKDMLIFGHASNSNGYCFSCGFNLNFESEKRESPHLWQEIFY
jgi:hypothetical protein